MKSNRDSSDQAIVDYMRRHQQASIGELAELLEVTATAIRKRLVRLIEQGLVLRKTEPAGQGRPTHQYSLSQIGIRSAGNNCEDLASVLWSELRAVQDPEVRRGLLGRVASHMGELYRGEIEGNSLRERMAALVGLMGERGVPFELVKAEATENTDPLPVLTALACPYPDLAEQDRSICSMEKMLFSEILGESVRLSACRLDGASCCTFEVST